MKPIYYKLWRNDEKLYEMYVPPTYIGTLIHTLVTIFYTSIKMVNVCEFSHLNDRYSMYT